MARYAVGDLQGCLTPLQCLLEEVSFNPQYDELWLVGDLVNRGPQSLEVLEFLFPLRDALRITLGNHDLHTIALARGATSQGRHTTLEALLASPRLHTLMDWLRQQPLCIRSNDGRYVMSHAGVPPMWSTEQALAFSDEVCRVLRDDRKIDDFLQNMYGNEPARWSDTLDGSARLRTITNYFTRMRLCDKNGSLNLRYKGKPEDAPTNVAPWFSWPPLTPRSEIQLFGHWAALEGRTDNEHYIGLDTGCVWGRTMTLYNLDTGAFHQCACSPDAEP